MSAGIAPDVGQDIVGQFPPGNPGHAALIYWDPVTKKYIDIGIGTNLTVSGGNLNATGGGSGGLNSFTSPGSTITIGGTLTDPTVDINLAHANTWTAAQIFQSNYTGQAPSGAEIILNNTSASGQNIISFRTIGSATGQIRSDYNGNMSYAAYASGVHAFYINGDYPTGTPVGQIGTTSYFDGGGITTTGAGGLVINNSFQSPGIADTITSNSQIIIGDWGGIASNTGFMVDINLEQYSFTGSSNLNGDAPLYMDLAGVLTSAAFSGNNRVMATATGTLTNKGLAEWDVNGNLKSTLTPDGNYTFTGTQTYFSTRAIIGNTTDPTGAGFSLVAYTASNITAAFISTTTYGAGGGAGMVAIADRGSAVTSGARLGYLFFNGAIDSSHNYYYSAGIEGIAVDNFSGTVGGSKLVFSVTASGTQTRNNTLVLDQDKSATFLGNILTSASVKCTVAGQGLYVKQGTNGLAGTIALTAGVGTVSISGLVAADIAKVALLTGAGTLGSQYKAVCTSGTLTITSLTTANSTQALDTSTIQYDITKAA